MSSSLYKLEVKNREIPFIFEESNTLPIVSLKIIFRNSGANFDNKSGLANLSASLLQEGTLELGSEEFSLLLEESAINFSVGVGRETLVLNLDSITESFDRGVELLIKLLNSPNFSEEAFNRVQKRIYGQILQKKSNFDFVAKSELDREVWKGTPLEFPKVGTEESLEKIKLEDVKNFVSKHLVISKAIPVIGGDLNISQAEEILKKILSKLPEGETGNLEKYSLFEKRESKTMFKDTKQAYIYFSAPLNLDLSSEDIYKSKVAFFILGSSGFGSRLMEEVRVKRGLAYSVYAYGKVEKSYSIFGGHLQTKNENLQEAKTVVKSVIADFISNGANSEELESAKKFILGSEPLTNETLSQRVGRSSNEFYKGFEIGHSKKELKKIEKLSLEELNSFISKHKEILNLTFSIVTKEN